MLTGCVSVQLVHADAFTCPAATRKVITIVEDVPPKDLSSSDLQRFLPWSGLPNRPQDTTADGSPASSASHSRRGSALYRTMDEWQATSSKPSDAGSTSPASRSRRGSTLYRTMDEWQATSPKISDAGSEDSGYYEGNLKPGVSHGRRRQSSQLMSEQFSGDFALLDTAAYPGSLQPRATWGSSHGSSRRSSVLSTQEQSRRVTSLDPFIDAAPALGTAASPQAALAASKARRSSMTVVDLQRPAYSGSGAGSDDVLSPLTKTANAKQARRGSLPFIPQDFETRMSQLVSSLSPTATTAAATSADAPAGPDEAGEAQQYPSLRPDRRSKSLDTLWEQTNMPASGAALGTALGAAGSARSASGFLSRSPQGSPKSQISPKAQISPKSSMHSAASLASLGRRHSHDIGASSAGAAGRVTPLPLHLLADPVTDYTYHKSSSTPLPAVDHAHKAERVRRSKTGFSSSGAGQASSSSNGGADYDTDGDDSKSGAETIRRYVPQIHKIDKLAFQRGGELDCTAYDSLLDVRIAQGLSGL